VFCVIGNSHSALFCNGPKAARLYFSAMPLSALNADTFTIQSIPLLTRAAVPLHQGIGSVLIAGNAEERIDLARTRIASPASSIGTHEPKLSLKLLNPRAQSIAFSAGKGLKRSAAVAAQQSPTPDTHPAGFGPHAF